MKEMEKPTNPNPYKDQCRRGEHPEDRRESFEMAPYGPLVRWIVCCGYCGADLFGNYFIDSPVVKKEIGP